MPARNMIGNIVPAGMGGKLFRSQQSGGGMVQLAGSLLALTFAFARIALARATACAASAV